MPSQKQVQRARSRIQKIFHEQRVDGVPVDIERGHSVEWAPPLNPGWYGIPSGDNVKWEVAPATIDVDDWLRVQANANNQPVAEHNNRATPSTVSKAKESIEFGTRDIPTPVLEIKADGTVIQEGRSRALGARRAGADRMPVWIAVQVYR